MLTIRQTIFHPVWPEKSVDIIFQIAGTAIYKLLENCTYDEEYDVWYTEDKSSCYAVIE